MSRVFKQKKMSGGLGKALYVVFAIIIIALILIALKNIGTKQDNEQVRVAEDAITKMVVQCYALETRYPPTLDYLVENYGLVLDEKKFIYHYRVVGENLMPEIKVFPISGGTGSGDEGGQ